MRKDKLLDWLPRVVVVILIVSGLAFLGAVVTENQALFPEKPAHMQEDAAPEPGSLVDSDVNDINTAQLPDSSFLYDTAIADLASADAYYDGLKVQITGEAVGEAINDLNNPEYCWVTLHDPYEHSSVVTHMRKVDAEKIDIYGAYGKTGAIVKIQGVFNLVCSDHDGESDIHVTNMVVVQHGSEHPDEFDPMLFVPGVAITVLGLMLLLVFWYLRERLR